MGQTDTEHKLVRRKFNSRDHYAIVEQWWERHNCGIPPEEFLSQNGLVIYVDKEPVACGFMYSTDSAFCYFAFCVVNPDSERDSRNKALDFLVQSACEWSERAGFKKIICNSEYKRFTKRLKDNGFVEPVKNVSHMFYEIKED